MQIGKKWEVVKELGIKNQELRIKELYHVDLYRVSNAEDVEGLGLLELMGQSETVVAIEWPDKIENFLPENRINIYFKYLGDDKREIRFD